MSDIIIPGFIAKHPNDTYLRDINFNEISATQIIQLDRHQAPDSGKIIELIRAAAEESTGFGRVCHLAKYIARKIPDIKERTKISERDETIIGRIRQSIPYPYLDPGRHYLGISHGIVNNDEIIKAEPDENDRFPGLFSWLIGEKSYNPWDSFTRLEEGLCLPADRDIQFAFQYRIFNSSFLKVNCGGNPFLFPEIEEFSRRVYLGSRLGNIEKLEDMSEWFEMKIARKTLRTYAKEKDIYECFEEEEAEKAKQTEDLANIHYLGKCRFDLKRPFSEN